ncbi:PREDICTED: O-glucosyltransferase rumi homolog isoform X2 [Nelumbo nucifera]|uniref:O-glucosyltransferase rumi homolog isoform X2 n=1 Tax=Nelumbo nucifera TaxID=4432 RepID=A0A1U7ZPU0_NELNU|nr:PREDICTED: O-glucosyltransferase rumi homolog isoform X2 [Nelumbo nucifera]
MGVSSRNHTTKACIPRSIFPYISILALFSLAVVVLFKVDDFIFRTKTVVGHNLEPTPWHLFPPKDVNEGPRYARASKIIQCSYLTCLRRSSYAVEQGPSRSSSPTSTCPSFFHWIHHDLEPWSRSRISFSTLMEARQLAAFRVVIVGGRLYVDFYYDCVQSRAMFTIWGFLQLLKRYPGLVPDVDLMFDCMDKPVVNKTEYELGTKGPPPPLFRYCTTSGHLDIPFPDWSFWGWPEVNIRPWVEEFKSIKQGSQDVIWRRKWPRAYWKGNPDVQSPIRTELLNCNDSRKWGAEILRQNWFEEAKGGFEQSKLSKQCNHRYKIYAEGYAWSVSLKYILSCGSLSLIISPQYEDFFSRGLVPKENYWPVSDIDLCRSIKFAVDWGNANPSQAEAIGKRGQIFMESLSMDRVYDYMYHLVSEYSKLQDFKPAPPSSAQEVCEESLLCFADAKLREFLESSTASSSLSLPCTLQPADHDLIESWIQKKRKIIGDVRMMEKKRA